MHYGICISQNWRLNCLYINFSYIRKYKSAESESDWIWHTFYQPAKLFIQILYEISIYLHNQLRLTNKVSSKSNDFLKGIYCTGSTERVDIYLSNIYLNFAGRGTDCCVRAKLESTKLYEFFSATDFNTYVYKKDK